MHINGDADGNADVDGADFLAWQRQLGSVAATASNAAVPEPASLVLATLGAFVAVAESRSNRRKIKPAAL